jgi:quercetin dioxygenase-like cupin family protein
MVSPANTLLRTTVNSIGQPIAYPRDGAPEVTAFLAEMAPGEETGWHRHPVPLLGYVLAGALTVYQATGGKRVVRAGEVSLESVGVVHNGVNEGTVPLKMIVFATGIKDVPFTVEETYPFSVPDADA